MSLQQIKAKLLAVSILAVSASGTFALFSSVPVVAKIATQPPFSIDKIQDFLIQQADFSAEPDAVRQSFSTTNGRPTGDKPTDNHKPASNNEPNDDR